MPQNNPPYIPRFGAGVPAFAAPDGTIYFDTAAAFKAYIRDAGVWNAISASGAGGPVGANPTATAGPAAIDGVAATFMRSDAAPAIQKASDVQFGIVEVDNVTITAAGGVITAVGGGGGPVSGNPTATASDVAVNGIAATFMRSDAAPAIQKATAAQFGLVQVDGVTITEAAGVISAVGGGGGGFAQFANALIDNVGGAYVVPDNCGAVVITTGAFTNSVPTLPAAPTDGQMVIFFNAGGAPTGTVTITPNAGQLFVGSTDAAIGGLSSFQWTAVFYRAANTTWYSLGGKLT